MEGILEHENGIRPKKDSVHVEEHLPIYSLLISLHGFTIDAYVFESFIAEWFKENVAIIILLEIGMVNLDSDST